MMLVQEIRFRLTKQILEKADLRKKSLKVEKFYFDQPIDGIGSFKTEPIDLTGNSVSLIYMKGSTLRKILESIQKGDIYSWIEYKGSRCKIRPKKIDK